MERRSWTDNPVEFCSSLYKNEPACSFLVTLDCGSPGPTLATPGIEAYIKAGHSHL